MDNSSHSILLKKSIETLQSHWGYNHFRPSQIPIIEAILSNNNVLGILPTGGGKSICFQVPGIVLGGCNLVISPLISLIEDQVQQLIMRKINAISITHNNSTYEIKEILQQACNGAFQFIYCSPERLQSEIFNDYAHDIDWNLLIIDEAHCISEWGNDFRPSYRKIIDFASNYTFKNIVAFTASATQLVEKDIIETLHLNSPKTFRNSIYRSNIVYKVLKVEDKIHPLLSLIKKESSIIYCPTRGSCEYTHNLMQHNNIKSYVYHAGIKSNIRKRIQSEWMQSDNAVICGTNAFGMGIDKPDVRKVVHIHTPISIENYYQEAGRAGRDHQYSEAVLLYNNKDIFDLNKSVATKFPTIDTIVEIYDAIHNYLQIPIQSGYDNKYFIDINAFCQKFNHHPLIVLSSINIIQQNGYWIFNNDDATKNIAQFIVNRDQIEELDLFNKKLFQFAINLLRIYGDILHYPISIDIALIAKYNNLTYEEANILLDRLNENGIISYKKATQGASLFMLENRLHKRNFSININRYNKLKENYVNKIQSIIDYVQNENICRSKFIAQYFNEEDINNCGKCDICINNSPFIKNQLLNIIKEYKSIDIKELYQKIDKDISIINKELSALKDEDLIDVNGSNIIFVS